MVGAATIAAALTPLNKKPQPWPIQLNLTKYPDLWDGGYIAPLYLAQNDDTTVEKKVPFLQNGRQSEVWPTSGANNMRFRVGPYGQSLGDANSILAGITAPDTQDAYFAQATTTDLTVVMTFSLSSTSPEALLFYNANFTNGQRIRFDITNDGFFTWWGTNSGSGNISVTGRTWETGKLYTVVWRVGADEQALYLNGEKIGSETSPPVLTVSASNSFNSYGNSSQVMDRYLFGFWPDRAFSESRCKALNLDPFSLIRPDPAKVFPYLASGEPPPPVEGVPTMFMKNTLGSNLIDGPMIR